MELDKLKWKAGVMNKGYSKDGVTYFTKIEETSIQQHIKYSKKYE